MEYCEFMEEVKAEVEKLGGDSYDIRIQEIPKNNGYVAKGIAFLQKGEEHFIAPAIHLESYYERYLKSGLSVVCTAKEIFDCAIACVAQSSFVSSLAGNLADFENVRNKIFYRLVDKEGNRELLKNVPFVPYCDLAIVFYLYVGEEANGHFVAQITNEHMELYQTDVDTLYNLAKENTPRIFPPEIKTMNEVLKQLMKKHMKSDYDEAFADEFLGEIGMASLGMYVLTNQTGINGASVILYDGLLKGFAEKVKSDLIILPSSCHEVIAIPYKEDMDVIELENMVRHINGTEVPMVDVLSDGVYRYSRATDCVTAMPGNGPARQVQEIGLGR